MSGILCIWLIVCCCLVYTVALQSFDGIELLGRFSLRDDEYAADWSGSGIRFNVLPESHASTITIDMTYKNCQDNCKYFVGIFVNHEEVQKVEINPQNMKLSYSFPSSLSKNKKGGKSYNVELRKITEPSCADAEGVMVLGDLTVTGGTLIGNTHPYGRRMLVIGDSITCGYGVDQNDPCTFTAGTEDVTHAYGYLVSQSVHSDVDIVAWSGKGVVRNYGDVNQLSELPMPQYYNRTLSSIAATSIENNYWMPHRYVPDLIIIALGTNDYSTQPQPSDDQFINGYVSFIHQIQKDYPKAKILSICQPMNTGKQCENTEAAAKQGNVEYLKIPESTISGGYGCSGHPNYASQQNNAQAIVPVVQKMMNW